MSLDRKVLVSWPADLDYRNQSTVVPGTKRPGQTAHFRNAAWGFIDTNTPGSITTLPAAFDAGIAYGRERQFLGHRPLISKNPLKFADHYVWETYGDVDSRRRHIGSALHHLFQTGELGGGDLPVIGLWSVNRPEWQIVDLALQAYQKVSVTLYDTLGPNAVEYIANHAHVTVVFSSAQHIPILLKLSAKIPALKMIVCFDDLSVEIKHTLTSWGSLQNIQVKELREIEALGKAHLIEPLPAQPHQIASICYTSGTTSDPKGVILTHANLALAAYGSIYGINLLTGTTLLSYLPLAHIYERVCELVATILGGRIGYFSGDPLRLLEDAQILRPEFFPSVPRVLNRVYQSVMVAGNAPGLKGILFRRAMQAKLDRFHDSGDCTHPLWDRLIFRKIQAVLGGNVQLLFTGSAPISSDVMGFLKIAFCCDVIEGTYGMTENSAISNKTWPGDPTANGTVGPPQAVSEIKLIDVPTMGYTSEDKPNPRGELCTRGSTNFSAYYKDEKKTRETIDKEGWTHSGDIAELDECGRFKIIDRTKNIMKLAQGEYVALEKIENTYSTSPVATQIYVHGDSLQSYLIGLVVCDPAQLAAIASSVLNTKVNTEDALALATVAEDPLVNDAILKLLTVEAEKNGLRGFEMVKRIHIIFQPFTIEDNTLTPTFKLRRRDVYSKYAKKLDALYALGDPKL